VHSDGVVMQAGGRNREGNNNNKSETMREVMDIAAAVPIKHQRDRSRACATGTNASHQQGNIF